MNYTINSPTVVYDYIDKDVVIVHLERGHYYNLSDVGLVIWMSIDKLGNFNELYQSLLDKFSLDGQLFDRDLENFYSSLLTENLINQSEVTKIQHDKKELQEILNSLTQYLPPILNKYTDMEDFLLLDPVHDVSSEGWPNK